MSTLHCHQVRSLLMAWLDSELDAATTVSMQEHLSTCSSCARRMAAEERLEGALGRLLHDDEPMPADVSARLDAALAREAGSPAGRSGSSPDGSPGGSRSGRRQIALRWLVAAALLLSATWLALHDPDPGVPTRRSIDLAGEFVASWRTVAESQAGPLDILDRSGARALLDAHALQAFELPDDGRLDGHPLRLLGAREERFHGVRAVNVLYDCCGALTSVFVLRRDGLDALGGVSASERTIDGVRTRTTEHGELLIGVVSAHASSLADHWSS